jgi:hypothetical protein
MEPANYVGDNFARVSRIYTVTLYNIACCYSSLKQGDAALEAIEECMKCGFDDYKKVCARAAAATAWTSVGTVAPCGWPWS